MIALAGGTALASPCDPVVEALDTGVNGAVHAMASVKRGESHQLYIAGKFMTAGDQVMNHIAMWDGNGWNAYRFLPFEPPTYGIPGSRGLTALEAIPNPFDPKSDEEFIMVGGDLLLGDSDSVRVFFPMEVSITGSPISEYDSEVTGFGITDIAYGHINDSDLIALGGDFHTIDEVPIERLALRSPFPDGEWSPVIDSSFVAGAVAQVEFIQDETLGDGLYFAGLFDRPGTEGPLCNSIARWDGTEFHPLGSGLTGPIGTPSPATTMVYGDIGEGPSLYVAGSFTVAGGIDAVGIARWDGSSWHALGEGRPLVLGQPSVGALAIFDDGSGPALYAGPAFSGALARWNGEAWQEFSEDLDGSVYCMIVHDDGSGSALYIGGDFSSMGATPVSAIARIRRCSTPCPGDSNDDGEINLADLNLVLANFGETTGAGDANGDGVVDLADLNLVLANFGETCV
ncbi:MAG: hypothetical protein ACIAQF_03410 [Phycisphaerales bacterium JB065]